jgi:hemerythrin-like domain-containing protein
MFAKARIRHLVGAGDDNSFRKTMTGKAPQSGNGSVRTLLATPREVGDLLTLAEAHHAGKLRLCDQLEAIADSLPDSVDPQICLAAARSIQNLVTQAHKFEESSLWPVLRLLRSDDERLEASLERLRYEHWEDESYAEELVLVLTDWGMCAGTRDAEATGYMLRGFFEGLRRHVAFEREHVVPLLQQAPGSAQ